MIHDLRFRMLCRRHSDEIFRYARSLLGNAADAEDATQEVLLRLWRNLSDIPLLRARAWLYRTARNHCIDQIRRRSAPAAAFSSQTEAIEDVAEEFDSDPSRAASREELRARIDAALQSLPEVLRSVFILYEINGLRYREIASHLGIPLNSVKVHLLRARRKLQELLRKEEAWMNL